MNVIIRILPKFIHKEIKVKTIMKDADALGLIAIILAIIGFFIFGLIFGIIAIILAIIGLVRVKKNILCIIGLILGIIVLILAII